MLWHYDARVSQTGREIGNGSCSRGYISTFLKAVAKQAGLEKKRVSGHSLRIGGATQLMAAEFTEAVIMLMGRWLSDSYKVYLRLNPNIAGDVAMRVLCKSLCLGYVKECNLGCTSIYIYFQKLFSLMEKSHYVVLGFRVTLCSFKCQSHIMLF